MTEAAMKVVPTAKSLVTKLAEVMGEINRVPKTGHNAFHNYDYATEADIVAAVRAGMAARQMMLVPSVEKTEWREVPGKTGPLKVCMLTVRFSLFDGESGEKLEFIILGEGQDQGDKATYKAMTGAVKYALLKLFLIPTGDDPENDNPAPKAAPPANGKGLTAVKAQVAAKVQPVSQRVTTEAPLPGGDPRPEPPAPTEAPPHDPVTGEVDEVDARLSNDPDPNGFMTFGSGKGKHVTMLQKKDLGWYQKCLMENVANPEKARYQAKNQLALDAVNAELRTRK